MTNNEQVLLESQAARSSQLAQIDDQAEELLSKAKALHFNVWQGTGIATTEQVAEFYEVPIETVKSAVKYHKTEFDADGLKVLRGRELKDARLKFNLASKTSQSLIWNPRATLRLGYLLRDSSIAKAVRTTSLDFIENAAKPKAAPPKSQAEMLLAYAQLLVDQEQRVQAVEARVNQIEQRSIDALEALNVLPAPTELAPPLTERDSLRKLINAWCRSNNIDHQEAWRTLYTELYVRDGFSVNARIKNSKAASKLELVAEHGKLGILYAIATEIFKVSTQTDGNGSPINSDNRN
jgi:hypothetical protein